MAKETPIQRLDYYTLVIGTLTQRPMTDERRHAVALHVQARLPEAVLRDLYDQKNMTVALDAIKSVLSGPRLVPNPPLVARRSLDLT